MEKEKRRGNVNSSTAFQWSGAEPSDAGAPPVLTTILKLIAKRSLIIAIKINVSNEQKASIELMQTFSLYFQNNCSSCFSL